MDSKDAIREIFQAHDLEEIAIMFSKSELMDMYKTVYGRSTASYYTKQRITNDIWRYFASIDRAQALKP